MSKEKEKDIKKLSPYPLSIKREKCGRQ